MLGARHICLGDLQAKGWKPARRLRLHVLAFGFAGDLNVFALSRLRIHVALWVHTPRTADAVRSCCFCLAC